MNLIDHSKPLPEWTDYLDQLTPIGDSVLATVQNRHDPQVRQETWKGLMGMIAHGVIAHVYADPSYPEFVSVTNTALNILAPNPDFMYTWTPVSCAGVYRLRGFRNSARFAEIGILSGWYAMEHNNGTVGTIDLDTVHLNRDTSFDFIVSRKRPEGYAGDWFAMPEAADNMIVRSACYDWITERDSVIAIERLDVPAARPRMSAEALSSRLSGVARWAELSCSRHHGRIAELEGKGLHNRLHVYDYTAWGGAKDQVYMEGLYKLQADEALILETDVPASGRYWGWMVTDDQLGTIDWMNRQSSLNALQATIDSDGRFRAVISNRDPAVPNWLDIGEYRYGMIWGRWNNCSSCPIPTTKTVKLADLRTHLPLDTLTVTPEKREENLRLRRLGAQLRRRW